MITKIDWVLPLSKSALSEAPPNALLAPLFSMPEGSQYRMHAPSQAHTIHHICLRDTYVYLVLIMPR